jgi:hypothetical protein
MKSTKTGFSGNRFRFTSCKRRKAAEAEKVDSYVMYVDSLGNVAAEDARKK